MTNKITESNVNIINMNKITKKKKNHLKIIYIKLILCTQCGYEMNDDDVDVVGDNQTKVLYYLQYRPFLSINIIMLEFLIFF